MAAPTNEDLESRFFYRLVRVFYFAGMGFFSLIILFLAYFSIPYKYIDDQSSYVACSNGNTYTFSSLNIYWDQSQHELSSNDDENVTKMCGRRDLFKEKVDFIPDNYKLYLIYKISGNWKNPFLILFLGVIAIYSFLNIFSETLIYLAFGKKFTWGWLRVLSIKK